MEQVRKRRVVDPQRQRLYAAEKVLADRSVLYPELPDAQRYVDAVLRRKLVREEFDTTSILVEDGRGRHHPCARPHFGAIYMPRATRMTYFLLHEIAHVLVNDARPYNHTLTPHGSVFVGAYLLLVDEFMGVEAGRLFRDKLREHRVDWASWGGSGSIRPSRSLISRS